VTKSAKFKAAPPPAVTRDNIIRLFGDVEDEAVVEVLGLKPTVDELEQAYVWLDGEGDRLSRAGHPQSERIGEIIDILRVEEEEEPSYLR
jgi:hypothetical protein